MSIVSENNNNKEIRMEVVNYLPGDQRLVDKIVYELKSQGIFDQFRKECFADVDTKPAYQNLRQRVEGNVSSFLRDQSWKPDMNKNQVREMLRRKISESGYLETGVERIVDQVVNPKINTIFLPKVEEVVYKFLGIQKPSKEEKEEPDLLPNDLEAVSPESEPIDKKDDKSIDKLEDLDDSKMDEDESPPFEPLDEQTTYLPHEENSVDSHISGISVSQESNHSNENKIITQIEQDSQMSRNSSDSRLSIITSDENSKMDICDDSQTKSIKSTDSKSEDKSKYKEYDKNRSREYRDRERDKDKRSSKDSRSRHSSSSKDKDRKGNSTSTSTSSSSRDNRSKDRNSKSSSSSSTKHGTSSSSSSRDRTKSESSSKDRGRSSSSSYRDKDKSKSKSSSVDKYKHSSSSSSSHDRHRKDSSSKERKRDTKPKDDHYSSKDKKTERRSTDRDSNDGQPSKQNNATSSSLGETSSSQSQKSTQDSTNSGDSTGNSDNTESTTQAAKPPINVSDRVETTEVVISSPLRIAKPKFASNMKEAMKLMKIRKQLAKLEKQNQLGFASVDVKTDVLNSASISLDEIQINGIAPKPLENTVISQINWDEMEAKLQQQVGEFQDTEYGSEDEIDVKCFEPVELDDNDFIQFVTKYIEKFDETPRKRRFEDNDIKNNNKSIVEKKRKVIKRNNIDGSSSEKFPLPLSPAESDVSKEEVTTMPILKTKRTSINKASSQRYSSDDLYKPRPTFASSRRRGAKAMEN